MGRAAVRRAAAALMALATSFAGIGVAPVLGDESPTIVIEDGVTQPVFGYLPDAIRERLWVESPFDTDSNGVSDLIAIDVMRPAATEAGLKVPVIMDPSPYYSTLCRGNDQECKDPATAANPTPLDPTKLLDKWPLFYDNYFVPRGYAVILMDSIGTANSTGCPTVHNVAENEQGKIVIDWLNGRATARDKDGNLATADWHNGKTGVIGKSYDGTLANAFAVTGVEGLTTIVPIAAIQSYYDYTRSNGVIQRGNSYVSSLANTVTDANRRAYCAPVRNAMAAADGDEHGDYSPFWAERDFLPHVGNIDASVFVIHGLTDENVRPDHFSKLWYALEHHDVPRKLWILRGGHVEPFDVRRPEWVNTLHRWFDHWLWDVDNGIMDEPMVDIQTGPQTWETRADWPIPGTAATQLWLQPGPNAGVLGLSPATGAEATTTFSDANQSEANFINNPTSVTGSRRVFLSPVLTEPVRISGTPLFQVEASVSKTDTNFVGFLVDYGPAFARVPRTSEGIQTGIAVTNGTNSPLLVAPAMAGENRLRVSSLTGFAAGQSVTIDPLGGQSEAATVASVATGSTTMAASAAAGAVNIKVASNSGFSVGQTILIDSGSRLETRTILTVGSSGAGGGGLTLTSALAMAHGTGTVVTGTGLTLTAPLGEDHLLEDCWGPAGPNPPGIEDACFRIVRSLSNSTTNPWRVTKGILDAINRDDVTSPTPLTVGQRYRFSWPLLPEDYTFPAGHQIGIVIGGQFSAYGSQTDSGPAGSITLSLRNSRVVLPIVGGHAAAAAAGLAGLAQTSVSLASNTPISAVSHPPTFSATVAGQAGVAAQPVPDFVAKALPDDTPDDLADLSRPDGQIRFVVDGEQAALVEVDADGSATWTPASLPVGSHQVSAEYLGEAGEFATSASALLAHEVKQLLSTTTELASSANPQFQHEPVTLTATVTAEAPGTGIAGTNVRFTDGPHHLATVPVDADGVAELTTVLGLGTHHIQATYLGDTQFAASASPQLTQRVVKLEKDDTATTISAAPNPVAVGAELSLTANVSAVPPGTGTPTGTVQFQLKLQKSKSWTALGGPVQLVDGVAVLNTSAVPAGSHNVRAVYSGDFDYHASASESLSLVVTN